jgi:4a-hydroxytetrahydrobiopterin dehydratase
MSLLEQHCRPGAPALADDAIAALLAEAPGWALQDGALRCSFAFRDYYQTIAFVNALAWMVHQQDHHPELTVGYNRCAVSFNTHSAGGAVSQNDFICAARTNAIYAQRAGA